MKRLILTAALALAACGQAATTAATDTGAATTTGPQGLMEQTLAQSPEMRPVAATQALMAFQTAHAESAPKCTEIRQAAALGVIPSDAAEGSIYKAYAGSLAFAVQCGPRLTTVRADPRQHWLVVMAPGATDAAVLSCAAADGSDRCVNPIPRGA